MALSFNIKQNDTLPSIILDPVDENGDALDISDVTDVYFLMRSVGSGQVKVNAAASIYQASALKYDWEAVDTDTVGTYQAEFECITADGRYTIPTSGYITVTVIDDIANGA